MDQDRLALLKKIGEARFTCVELNLYLDTHPDDTAARADFNTYSASMQQLRGYKKLPSSLAEAYTAASQSSFVRKFIPASVIEAYGR